jgi:hypothetical protein
MLNASRLEATQSVVRRQRKNTIKKPPSHSLAKEAIAFVEDDP